MCFPGKSVLDDLINEKKSDFLLPETIIALSRVSNMLSFKKKCAVNYNQLVNIFAGWCYIEILNSNDDGMWIYFSNSAA